jgi:hypothetical protein
MIKKESKLKIAQDKAEKAIFETNKSIDKLGEKTMMLSVCLNNIQDLFGKIRNVPNKEKLEYESLKEIRLNWKQQAEKIERDYQKAKVEVAGQGAAGVGTGVAVAALGPTAAMGIATTFGVASTGTAISTLSGAAATNAALAWLGGGALAVNGGGMAAGQALLTLAGPVGWAIAGVALITSGLLFLKSFSNKKKVEDIFTLISERDVKSYSLAIVELNERISRIVDESKALNTAIDRICSFGLDYNAMSEYQQYELGAYVNLMRSSTQLLTSPIMGLQPKFTSSDYNEYLVSKDLEKNDNNVLKLENVIISFSNLFYKIELDDKDKKILYKTFKKNKKMLESLELKKKQFTIEIMDVVEDALKYKYNQ